MNDRSSFADAQQAVPPTGFRAGSLSGSSLASFQDRNSSFCSSRGRTSLSLTDVRDLAASSISFSSPSGLPTVCPCPPKKVSEVCSSMSLCSDLALLQQDAVESPSDTICDLVLRHVRG
ncbi:UNVERIFIED_CONTAM: hypothetical protein FKN15_051128 [Acipenser sinensis]